MELLEHAFEDTIVFIPFLLLTYLILTYFEHRDSIRFHDVISRYKYFGPVIGALLGVIPQCGFSVMAACLYLNSSLSLGTLIAVFYATSDEAIPMLLAQPDQFGILLQLIAGKVIFGMAIGYLVDLLGHFHFHEGSEFTPTSHCHRDNVWKEALLRTLSVTAFIFVINFMLTALMHVFTEETISSFMSELGFLQPMLCSFIGFIPNCASSVLLCELFLHGFITSGSLFAGLVCNAGLGLTIFFRVRGAWKDLVLVMFVLFAGGIMCGMLM